MKEYLCNISEIKDVFLNVKPIFLFINSMRSNFNCADILVRILAIEYYYGKNNYGFDIYNEMQKKRVLKNPNVPNERAYNQKRFENLIKSFEEKGFMVSYPLQVNKELEILDGAHRLSLALYHHVNLLPIYFSESRLDRKIDYSLNWFRQEGMEKYIPIILNKYNELKNDYKEKIDIIIYANQTEYEKYYEKISQIKELKINSATIISKEMREIIPDSFILKIQRDDDKKNFYIFNIEINYEIRKVKIVNDRITTFYDEFDIEHIPYIVIDK